ncbi:MAG TPA: hypothetical protein V6D27_05985 [Vampirovibrionales bacterium]
MAIAYGGLGGLGRSNPTAMEPKLAILEEKHGMVRGLLRKNIWQQLLCPCADCNR